ncbi:ATP-binding protein [Schaalia sp. lx-100]|uniref:ATP-binding protein n=1 Tax=Schaalia sp. lx-100 TaxID=2899081 RepID=UPI001E3EFEF2|nr:ATP-binding protein [Schaalia sp. lx-100]MCD4557330.1 AAA family ATPase [Schaalia sp. lx-100]
MSENPTFWIKEVRITSSDIHNPRKPSIITLIPGVNIIHGPSDTGKTYLARSIRFVLAGGSTPFPRETGYDTVTITLETEHGPATFKRQIGFSQVEVRLPHEYGIPSQGYPVSVTEKTKGQMTVSDILLRLVGVKMGPRGERRQIITNQYARKEDLTWRHLHQVLQRAEGNITSETSIFGQNRTATLTAFDLIFNDTHHEDTRERRDPREEARRWEILQPEYSRELEYLKDRIEELEGQVPTAPQLEDLTNARATIKEQIQQLQADQKDLRSKLATQIHLIHEADSELDAQRFVSDQNEQLAGVYLSNIERLTAIAEAQEALSGIDIPTECPTCGAPVETDSDAATAIKQQAAAELETLITDLRSLRSAQEALKEKIDTSNNTRDKLAQGAAAIESALAEFLQPQLADLSARVSDIEQTMRIAPELEYLKRRQEYVEKRQGDIILLTQEPDDEPFNPLAPFGGYFEQAFSTYLRDILHECAYVGSEKAGLDLDSFDIKIGAKGKASHGKGYRAFFNFIMLMALRRYLKDHAVYKPGFVIIDTPTLGLEQNNSDTELVSERAGGSGRPKLGLIRRLFDYALDHAGDGQLIIINNTDVTPLIDYHANKANEIVFTGKESEGRAGLLEEPLN